MKLQNITEELTFCKEGASRFNVCQGYISKQELLIQLFESINK